MISEAAFSAPRLARRAVLAGAAIVLGRPASARPLVAPSQPLAFRMMRHGSEIGRHSVAFIPQGDRFDVRIEVDARVSFAGVTLVRYAHRATETWREDGLVALTADTDRNGPRQWARATRIADALAVTGSQTTPYTAPANAVPTTYWNRHMLEGAMISSEDGVLLRPSIADRGFETIPTASGTVEARHFALTGAFAVDVWYDRRDVWAGLSFTVADGSDVRYERL